MMRAQQFLILVAVVLAVGISLYLVAPVMKPKPPLAQTTPTATTSAVVSFKSETFKKISQLQKNHPSARSAKDEDRAKSQDLTKQAESAFESKAPRDQVKKLLKEALSLDRDNAKALANLSELTMESNDLLQARELATQCLGVDKNNLVCHRVLVASFTRTGKWDEAHPFLTDCLSVNPDDILCLGAMSSYQLNARQFNESKETVEKLKRLDPNSMWTHVAEADYLAGIGEKLAAAPHYKRACEMGQTYACEQYKQFQN